MTPGRNREGVRILSLAVARRFGRKSLTARGGIRRRTPTRGRRPADVHENNDIAGRAFSIY